MSCGHVFVAPGEWCIFCRRIRPAFNTVDARCAAHAVAFCGVCAALRLYDSREEPARSAARDVEQRCAAAHRREVELAAWAAALVSVLVCLGQLAAERAPPSKVSRFGNLEVD